MKSIGSSGVSTLAVLDSLCGVLLSFTVWCQYMTLLQMGEQTQVWSSNTKAGWIKNLFLYCHIKHRNRAKHTHNWLYKEREVPSDWRHLFFPRPSCPIQALPNFILFQGKDLIPPLRTAPLRGWEPVTVGPKWGGGRAAEFVTSLWLVGGEIPVSRDLNHQPSDFKQSGVRVLVLSLKFSLSRGWGS